jgi:alpha-tubulin suppressor-like RCC1 family protein
MNTRPGIVYYTSLTPHGSADLIEASNLHGIAIYGIQGNANADGVVALTENGVLDIVSDENLCDIPLTSYSCGYNHKLGCSSDGNLYTWGEGRYGELGHGSSKVQLSNPTQTAIHAKLSYVSAGDNFSLAQDNYGNVFAWGQNFDKQLGLYIKNSENLSANSVIEELLYVPRSLPISIKDPIQQIACGPNFSLVISISGKLYSWGAGECGQLGTGRCTKREHPQQVILSEDGSTVQSVSCGKGHVLALTTTGKLYAWGLNTHSQLGVDDTKPKYTPTEVTSQENSTDLPVGKMVYADGYSSAMIDASGNLYTWGSTAYHRLMHPIQDISTTRLISRPKFVEVLAGNSIETIAFAKKSSAVLIRSTLNTITPSQGPQKSMSKLRIYGYGFYQSDSIIIKFTSKHPNSTRTAPRSCLGQFISSTEIVCKPPKLNDHGEYHVTVSLDGKNFIPDEMPLMIYREFSIVDIIPRFIDHRVHLSSSTADSETDEQAIIPLKILCRNMTIESDASVLVKCVVSVYGSDSSAAAQIAEVSIQGTVKSLAEALPGLVIANPTNPGAHGGETPSTPVALVADPKVEVTDVDTNKVIIAELDLAGSGIQGMIKELGDDHAATIIIQLQISPNQIDYCTISNKNNSILAHSFEADGVTPNCLPTSSSSSIQLHINGHSFLPAAFLSKGTEVVASMSIRELSFQRSSSSSSVETMSLSVTAHCETFSEMTISAAQIMRQVECYLTTMNEAARVTQVGDAVVEDDEQDSVYEAKSLADIQSMLIDLTFSVKYRPKYHLQSSSSAAPLMESLSSSSISLTLYSAFPLTVSPSIWRDRKDQPTAEFKVEIRSNPLEFQASVAKIAVRNARSVDDSSILAVIDELLFEAVAADPDELSAAAEIPPSLTPDDILAASQAISSKRSYHMSFIVPPLKQLFSSKITETNEVDAEEESKPEIMDGLVYLDLQLDGLTPSPIDYHCPISIVQDVLLTPMNIPKGKLRLSPTLTK